jgi:filamentous hemagglutinin
MPRLFSKLTLSKSLQLKHAVVAWTITALVINPAMAQQQSAAIIQQQQARDIAERISVDRQSAIAAQLELQTSANNSDPALKESLNGTTVVDIATPSAKGVSNNNWNEFNVSEKGIIFNNSAAPVLTQLGGWSDGNRRLAGGEASIILNQVNGANRSTLLGQVEIAGKSAEFILANPNGITCNGCGFINTPAVSLITGLSRIDSNGDLLFDITQGDFLLEGKGVNATNLDRFDIVSRYAKINAELYANQANIITGANQFNYQSKQIASLATNAPTMQFALDSTALGGMYANRIKLIGTEKGLGVNLEGLVQSTDQLMISADGNIQFKQVQANNQIQVISTSGNITNQSLAYAKQVELNAANQINNKGLLGANETLTLTANQINQSGGLYAGLTSENSLNNTGTLTLNVSEQVINTGDIYVGGALNLQTPQIDNQGSWVLQTQNSFNTQNILNAGSIRFNTQDASITANTMTNPGDIQHLGSGLFTLNLNNNLSNLSGLLATNGNLTISGKQLLNSGGQIFADHAIFNLDALDNSSGVIEFDSFDLIAKQLNNQSGRIILQDATANQSLRIETDVNNQSGVLFAEAQDFLLTANILDNQQGNFIVNNSALAKIDVSGAINNQSGFLQSNNLLLKTSLFDNSRGNWLSENNDTILDMLINASGFIQGKKISLLGNEFDNQAGALVNLSSDNLSLDFAKVISNSNKGVIRNQNGDIDITTASLLNNTGVIDAEGILNLDLDQLINQQGSLQTNGQLQLKANDVDNKAGVMQSATLLATIKNDWNNAQGFVETGDANLTANNFDNSQAYLLFNGKTDIQLSGNLINQQGAIANNGTAAAESFRINAKQLDNTGEIIANATNATIKLDGKLTNSGVIENSQTLNIDASELINQAGSISANTLNLSADSLHNNSAVINSTVEAGQLSANQITINTNEFGNALNSLIYADTLRITHNQQGSLQITNQGDLVADHIDLIGDGLNNSGRILSATRNTDSLVFNFINQISNSGQISRNSDWTMTAAQFTNNGRIESLGSGEIKATTVVNTDLQKQNSNNSAMNISSDQGLISANGLFITSNVIDNRFGVLIGDSSPPPNLTLGKGLVFSSDEDSVIQLNNQNGFIQSGSSDWVLNHIQLNNTQGTIWHSGEGKAELNLVGNLDNSGGSIVSSSDLQIRLQDSDSQLINNEGLIQSKILDIKSGGVIQNTNTGALIGDHLVLTSNIINNQGGIIEAAAADTATLELNAITVNNTDAGEIRSGAKDWNLSLSQLNNDGGKIIHLGTGQLSLTSSGEFINKGSLFSKSDLLLDLGSLINDQQISARNLTVATKNGITNNLGASIFASNQTVVKAQNQVINNQGEWYLGDGINDSQLTGSQWNNRGDFIIGVAATPSETDSSLTLDEFNNYGNVSYNNSGVFKINANRIQNDAIGIFTANTGTIDLNLLGLVDGNSGFNNSGNIFGNNINLKSELNSQELINAGRMQANQFELNDTVLINEASGILFGSGNDSSLNLNNSQIINNGSWVNQSSNWTLQNPLGSGQFYHQNTGKLSLTFGETNLLSQSTYFGSEGSIDITGSIGGSSGTIVKNGESYEQRTTIFAQGDINFLNGVTNNQAAIESRRNIVISGDLENNGGKVRALGSLSSSNDTNFNFINSGQIQATSFALTVSQFVNAGSLLAVGSGEEFTSSIFASELDNQGGIIQIDNAVGSLTSVNALTNKAGTIAKNNAGSLTLTANQLDNTGGLVTAEAGTLKITANDQLINQQTSDQSQNGHGIHTSQLELKANSLINNTGVISIDSILPSANDNSIDVKELENSAGIIQLAYRNQLQSDLDVLRINASSYINNQNGSIRLLNLITDASSQNNSLINSKTDASLKIKTESLNNQAGSIVSDGSLVVDSQNSSAIKTRLTNAGDLQARRDISINAAGLSNSGKITGGDDGMVSLNLEGFDLDNIGDLADIYSFDRLNISADRINNTKQLFAKNQMDITTDNFVSVGTLASGGLVNITLQDDLSLAEGDSIVAPGALTITTPGDINNAGTISAVNYLLLNADALINDITGNILSGVGSADSQFTLNKKLINRGLINSQGNLIIETAEFINEASGRIVTGNYVSNDLIVAGNLDFDLKSGATGKFTNQGVIYSRGTLEIKNANSILNQNKAVLMSQGDMTIKTNTLENSESRIETFENLSITASQGITNKANPILTPSTISSVDSGHVFVSEFTSFYDSGTDWVTYNVWNLTETRTDRYTLNNYADAVISSGKNSTMIVDEDKGLILNEYGSIFVGGDLTISGLDFKQTTLNEKDEVLVSSVTATMPVQCQNGCGDAALTSRVYNSSITTQSTPLGEFAGRTTVIGGIDGSLKGKVTIVVGTPPAECDPATDPLCKISNPKINPITGSEFEKIVSQYAGEDVEEYFEIEKENGDVDGSGSDSLIARKSLDDLSPGNASDGSGATAQTSNYSGEEGKKAEDSETDLLNNADATGDQLTQGIPATIAKASAQSLKTNQWPLISFTVLPFNFDLNNLSGLYVVSKNPGSKYLIETRPEFTLYENFLGSDYLLERLGYNADQTIKRLGDAFFENMLIRDALIKETNSRYLGDTTSDHDTMQALMDNAVANATSLQLVVGVELTPEQCAALTHDMMWLVKKKINGQEVLVPHLYLTSVSPEKIAASNAAIGANGSVSLRAKTIDNQNSMYAGNNLSLTADLLKNNSSLGAGGNLLLATRGDLQQDGRLFAQGDVRILAAGSLNLNGSVDAANVIAVSQGVLTNKLNNQFNVTGNLKLQSTDNDVVFESTKIESNTDTKNIKSNSVQYVTGQIKVGGNITVDAGNDIQAQGTDFTAGGNINLHADRDINLQAMKNESNYEYSAKRKKEIHNSTGHDVVNITSGGNVTIDAGRDNNLIGTNVSAEGNVLLSADRDTNISAVVDSDYDYSYSKQKKSFGRSKTRIDETLAENVVGGTIDAGGNVLINAHVNAEGKIISDASGKVNILGAVINADDNIVISGDEDVNISGIEYNQLDYHQRKKSGLGGLNKKDQGGAVANQLLENAAVSAGKNVHLISGNDLNLVAADVVADGNINMEAVDQLLISAGDVKTKAEEWKNSSGLFTNGSLYNKQEHKSGERVVSGQASTIAAGGKVNATVGSGKIIGSTITGDQGVTFIADSGDIEVTTYQQHVESFTHDKEVSVGLGDLAKTKPDQWIQTDDGRAKMTFANASYDEVDNKTKIVGNQESSIQSNGDVKLIAKAGGVNIQGSDITADADGLNGGLVGLAGATGVNITEATDSYESQTKETHGSAEMSVVVQHQAVEVVKAAQAVDEAKDKLEQAKRDYKNYERNLDQLETQLSQLESDLSNKVPGVNVEDVMELRELIGDLKDDKEFYQAGVALAAVNLTGSVTALAQQTAAAAASVATWGFNAGVQLDIDASKTNTTEKSSTARGSNISGNKIAIQTGTLDENGKLNTDNTQTTIRGSNLIATQSKTDTGEMLKSLISVETGDLNILSSKNTTESSTKTEHGHITVQQTIYGAAGGASVSGSYDQNKSVDKSTTINNSQLKADAISLTTSNDLNIRGGNVRAEDHLEVDVGGDMNLESQQNRSNSRNVGFGVSGGMSFGGTAESGTKKNADGSANHTQGLSDVGSASGVNGGFNTSNGMSVTRETVLTSMTSGGTANVKVKGTTYNTGALLATTDENGKDLNQLNFETGAYVSTDLRNIKQNNQTSVGVSTNMGVGDKKPDSNPREGQQIAEGANGKTLNAQTSNLTYSNTNENSASKSLATLGHGNFTVGGVQLERDGELTEAGKANGSPLIGANRDTENTKKTLWDSSQSQTVDATLDHRLLSEDGRAEIKQEIDDIPENVQKIAQNVPAPAGGNKVENAVGEFLNDLGNWTKGITPSDANHGGLIAQLPVLAGADDVKAGVYQIRDSNDPYVLANPDLFMDATLIPYAKETLEAPGYAQLQGKVVSIDKISIDEGNATYQNATNGILNNRPQAIVNAMEQTGSTTVTQIYNPTHGLVSDLLESGVDKLFGNKYIHTGVAGQTGDFVVDIVNARGYEGVNIVAHSQGSLIMNAGLNTLKPDQFDTDWSDPEIDPKKIPTFFINGAPVRATTMKDSVDRLNFNFAGSKTNPKDPVGEFLGQNQGAWIPEYQEGSGKVMPITDSLLSAKNLTLITQDKYEIKDEAGNPKNETSPHSTYGCEINCGNSLEDALKHKQETINQKIEKRKK